MGTDLSELHSGYRAYSRQLLLTVPFLRNSSDFVFDSELLFQAASFGLRSTRSPPAAGTSTTLRPSASGPASSTGQDPLDGSASSPPRRPGALSPVLALKVSGERVSTPSGGFNPTWQRHVAAYALTAPSPSRARCSISAAASATASELLAPRRTVGVDMDADALAGQDRETVPADMRALPFEAASFDRRYRRAFDRARSRSGARAGRGRARRAARGVAVFVTPNRLTFGRPDEIIDPYHHVELDPTELGALCEEIFAHVELAGIFGSERYMEIFNSERAKLDHLLRMDPLRLRRGVPRRLRQRLYDLLLRRNRKSQDPRAEAIEVADFDLRREHLEHSLDVVAVCTVAGERP